MSGKVKRDAVFLEQPGDLRDVAAARPVAADDDPGTDGAVCEGRLKVGLQPCQVLARPAELARRHCRRVAMASVRQRLSEREGRASGREGRENHRSSAEGKSVSVLIETKWTGPALKEYHMFSAP